MLTLLRHRRKSFRAVAAVGLVETFADDSANEYEWSKGTSSKYVGTLVTPTSSYTATRLEFYLKKTGTGGGDITAEIWSATGSAGSETPDALLSTSTTTVSASSVSATKDWVPFYFEGGGQALVSGTKYFFLMKTSTTGDASNYYDLTLGSSYDTTNFETVSGDDGSTGQLTYSYWNTGTTTNPTTQSGFEAFFTGTPAGTGTHSTVINWDSNNSRGTKPTYLPDNSYAWQVEGYIYAATAGTYYFGTGSDDGNQLTIDGTIVTSHYGGRAIPGNVTSPNDTGSISLTVGYHTFRYRMQEGSGGDGGYVAWKPPGDSSYVVTPASVFSKATTSWVSANGGRGGYCRSYTGDLSFATFGMTLDATWQTIGTAYSTLANATSASAKVYCNFDKDDTGIIMEAGGSTHGLILYIHNETLYFQCGESGTAGGDSNTGEVSYTVTNTTAQDFIIEWSADTSGCALYVDKTLIGTDVFSHSVLSGTNDGTIGQGYSGIAVNRGSSGSFTGTVTKAEIFLGEVTSDVSGLIAGDAVILNAKSVNYVGGVESTIQADASSTVYGNYATGSMHFRDATKNGTWADDGLGLLWDHSTSATDWVSLIGTNGGTFNVYEEGTSTLIYSLAWSGTGAWSSNTDRYGSSSVDFTGTVPANDTRVDVYHVKS